MRAPVRPVFLERRGYRQRRMIDALKLLPVAGCVLLAIPLLWSEDPVTGVPTSHALIYIFGTWTGLSVIAGLLGHFLSDAAVEALDTGPAIRDDEPLVARASAGAAAETAEETREDGAPPQGGGA